MSFVKDYTSGSEIFKPHYFLTGKRTERMLMAVLFLLVSFSFVYAQHEEMKFEHLTANEGLSNNFITSIAQDTTGFIWFGTEHGLNKYDGHQISVYKFDGTDSASLINNGIWSMLIDSRGKFWVGTSTGLDYFDQKRNAFIHCKKVSSDRSTTSENVRCIYEDKKGNIWIGTYTGIAMVDQKEFSYTIHPLAFDKARVRISSIAEDSFGRLWVGTLSHGLFLFDTSKNIFTPYRIEFGSDKSATSYDPNDPRSAITQRDMITQIYEDRQRKLWIGTNDGLNLFDSASNTFIRYAHQEGNENSLSDATIHTLSEDQDGNLWIGHSKGVSILDKSRKRFTHNHYSIDNPSGLNNNYVTCIYKDRSGNMWLGTRNCGLNIYYSTGNNFKLFAHQPNNSKSLNNNIVKAIVKDKKGSLWLGTDGGGLNLLKRDGTFVSYQHDPKDPGSLPNNLVLALYEDKQENLWVSTFQGALSLMNRETGKFEHFTSVLLDTSKLRSASVSVLYEDSKQNLWVGTWYGGLHLFDRKTKKFRRYPFHTKDSTGLSSEKVVDIHELKNGKLLIAAGTGLNIFDPITQKFTHYFHNDSVKTSISNNGCNSICEDKSGSIWIGTNYGLNLFDPEKFTFQTVGSKEGLQQETIQGVLSDNEGNLWISTLKGIYKFNPKTNEERNYGASDGLQGNEFISHSYFKSADGEMFFGGINGANAIDPERIRINREIPPVVITDLKVFYKSVKAGAPDGILTQPISFTNEVTLSFKDYIFSIEFAALNYNNPKDNQYAYKLEGLDESWNHIGNQHSVIYTSLDPGEYTFRVKACNNDGIWNENGASLKIIITPPYWETASFKFLLAAGVITVLFLIYYIRIRNIKNQKKALEILVAQRTREIVLQKEEIEGQKESIERQFEEITTQNEQMSLQNFELDEVRKEVKEKNDQLEEYNAKLENTVKQRTKQLMQTNEELDQFVYRSAHDLKGPVSRIMGLCYLGALEKPDAKIIELLKLMERCTEEMSDKLTRLMNVHTISRREVTLEPVCYHEIIKGAIAQVVQEQNVGKVKFVVEIEDADYASDKYLLSILLKNVIENAVRFRDEQKTESYVKIGVSPRKNATMILISDNGLGIPPAQASKIFDMFVVSHESIKGFGLGLYEAKLIARKLNGNIKLQYPENKDTEFKIMLHQDDDE